jgi:S-adenosylmethionine synthetase
MKVLITGASGLLGRSLLRILAANAPEYEVIGLAFSRAEGPLRKLDLLDAAATSALFKDDVPDVVVHCAAERFPDRVDADPDRAKKLNVDTCSRLAEECAACGASLIYISTDYVFDGGVKSGVGPPYATDAPTQPVNFYGETKLAGEQAVLAVTACHPCVLRVPVLYGYDQRSLDESASLVVAEALRDPSAATSVDDWGVRFPTAVDDVSQCLSLILERKRDDKSSLCGVYHCSSPERSTKYTQAKLMAKVLGKSADHLTPNSQPPAGAPRPQNTQLDCAATWVALGATVTFTSLEAGYTRALALFSDSFAA